MIIFGCWSPDRAAWEASWKTAGIMAEDGSLLPPYAGCVDHTADTWPGIIEATPAEYDADGNEITPATHVTGWHCNVRVWGAVEAQMTAGLPQTGSLFERTHAAAVFELTEQPADPETGFPAGYRSAEGVTYADVTAFSSPSNEYV